MIKNASTLDKIQFTKQTKNFVILNLIQNLLSNRFRIFLGLFGLAESSEQRSVGDTLLAIRTCFAPSVRKSALTKREGNKYRNELINLSTYPLIYFQKAFTLAEVLITLAIIGIVAAMTIPNLIQKNFEQHAVSKLKETQSILAQAFKLSQEEYGEVEGWELIGWSSQSAEIIANNLKPFLKIAIDCGLDDTDKKCVPATYLQLNGQEHPKIYTNNRSYYKISLLNGTSIWWRAAQENDTLIMFFIDINGKQQPNTFGKDLFIFSYENGSVLPNGSPNSAHPAASYCKNKKSTGLGCAYYVIMQGNMNYLH